MPERIEFVPKQLAPREYLTPIDVFRASSSAIATAISGHTILTSATIDVVAVGTSNVAKLRLVGVHLKNNDSNWLEIQFRDGSFTGLNLTTVLRLNPNGDLMMDYNQLLGRAATSSIALVITSSPNTPPVSNGVTASIGFVPEQLDLRE